MSVVMELPIPNRDTLAYLCAHWQKVASNSNVNQMPIENIARCLGPTVVGGFSSIPKNARLADQQVILERQINVLNRLLRLTPVGAPKVYVQNIKRMRLRTSGRASTIRRW
jgi:hypothetical protein